MISEMVGDFFSIAAATGPFDKNPLSSFYLQAFNFQQQIMAIP
jgi:hypothetical protein